MSRILNKKGHMKSFNMLHNFHYGTIVICLRSYLMMKVVNIFIFSHAITPCSNIYYSSHVLKSCETRVIFNKLPWSNYSLNQWAFNTFSNDISTNFIFQTSIGRTQ